MFCDDWEQASHNGELAHAVEAGRLTRDDVTRARRRPRRRRAEGRAADDEITVFDSTGLAIQDLAIALAALERADGYTLSPTSTSDTRAGSSISSRPRRHLVAWIPEHRPRHEVAAEEPQDVAVTRIPARDPQAVAVRDAADQGQKVAHAAEDSGPAVRNGDSPPDEPVTNSSSAFWIAGVVASSSVYSASRARSRNPPRNDSALRRLLPVIESLPRVVRTRKEPLGDRLRHDTCPRVGTIDEPRAPSRPLG